MRKTIETDDFLPLSHAAKEIGCLVTEIFRLGIDGDIPLYVPCIDDIVEQSGVGTGRHFWVHCRLPEVFARELVRRNEVVIEKELLLAGTYTPAGTETWADYLLIRREHGGYVYRPSTAELRIQRNLVGVMEKDMDLVRAAVQRVKQTKEASNSASARPRDDTLSTRHEKACPAKFSLFWLELKLLDDEDDSFSRGALARLEELDEQQPAAFRSTHSIASSASELLGHWLDNRDLPAYIRGKLVDDYGALTSQAIACSLDEADDALRASIEIKRDDLVALIESENLPVPKFLRNSIPQENVKSSGTGAKRADGSWDRETLLAEHNALKKAGIASPTKNLAEKYGVSETVIKAQKKVAADAKKASATTHSSWFSALDIKK